MPTPFRPRRIRWTRLSAPIACVAAAGALGGCETSPVTEAGRLDVRAAIASGELHSPRGAAMTVASIDGAPGPIAERLRQDMASEAATREITITDPSLARYFVRGYVDAYPSDKGISVHDVWDVFDTAKHRTQRVEDAFDIPSAEGSDPWSGVNDAVVASIASRTADDLAVFLGKTPEAAGVGGPAEAPATPTHTAN